MSYYCGKTYTGFATEKKMLDDICKVKCIRFSDV